jgi:hypothetical protein
MAKTGYRLLIHRDIPEDCAEYVKRACEHFLSQADTLDGWKCRRISRAFYRRGILGFSLPPIEPKITIRRLVKNRRIFGVVPIDILEKVDGTPLELDRCMCAKHRGGTKVRIKGGFKEEDYDLYREVGDIRG